MPPRIALPILLAATLAPVCAAHAQPSPTPWFLRAGAAAVRFDTRTQADLGGQGVPGADVGVKDNATLALEIGYDLDPSWTARLGLGIPPRTTLSAGGVLAGYVPPLSGTLGRTRYAPLVLSLTRDLGRWGPVRPYVGAGVNYTWIVDASDGDVAGLRIRSAWGGALQAGFDVPLDARWSLFLDVRKIFVRTSATGRVPALGNPPAHVDLRLDPLVVQVGVGYRF